MHQKITRFEWFVGQAMANPEICTGRALDYQLSVWFPGRTGITKEEIASRQAIEFAKTLMRGVGNEPIDKSC